jgi:predicted nucleotidyltransferase
MDVSRPSAAITGRLEGEVITVLAGTVKPLTGRQIARMVQRGSDRGVRLALNRLAEQGLVHVVDAPPALLYQLNREHIAAPIAEALAGLRSELIRRLRDAIGAWRLKPFHASMFGSAARGDGGPDSDIDLFIVRPGGTETEDDVWEDQLADLAENVRAWTGNHAGISVIDERDVMSGRASPTLLDDIRRDAVPLAGVSPAALLAAVKGAT